VLVTRAMSPDAVPEPAGGGVTSEPDRGPGDEERTNAMTREESGRRAPERESPPDPLAEAEALRAALSEATVQAGRLVAALRARRKEKKALSAVWAGLRSLNLDPGGQR
jgi:hypothetical protein